MSKTLTLRLDDRSYRIFQRAAVVERRSLANLIETAALSAIARGEFVDDGEMAEIMADTDLVTRIRRGSRDARARRGKFVV